MPVAIPPLHGIENIFSKAAMARSGSPRRAAIRARISSDCGLFAASFSIGCKATARPVFWLFFEKGFQFGAGLSPGFLSGGVIAGDFLRPA